MPAAAAAQAGGVQTICLLFTAGFAAGVMNAVAGGGSFVSFPALIMAGVPSVEANASSTVALLPGSLASSWTFRRGLRGFGGVGLPSLLAVSVAGGLAGAALLLATPQRTFDAVIPWLLLLATLSFAFGRDAGTALRSRVRIGRRPVLVVQFLLAVYGGYFGGAVGIMMMAAWHLLDGVDLKAITPARTLIVSATNAVAVAAFIVLGAVWWRETLVMVAASTLGGFAGAHLTLRLDARVLRAVILAITATMTVAFFLRAR